MIRVPCRPEETNGCRPIWLSALSAMAPSSAFVTHRPAIRYLERFPADKELCHESLSTLLDFCRYIMTLPYQLYLYPSALRHKAPAGSRPPFNFSSMRPLRAEATDPTVLHSPQEYPPDSSATCAEDLCMFLPLGYPLPNECLPVTLLAKEQVLISTGTFGLDRRIPSCRQGLGFRSPPPCSPQSWFGSSCGSNTMRSSS